MLDIKLADDEAVMPVADALAERRVPFLFATGYGPNCATGGHTAAPVLHKPFAPQDLVVAVEALGCEPPAGPAPRADDGSWRAARSFRCRAHT